MTSGLLRGLGWALLTVACWGPLFSLAKRTLPVMDAFALGTVRYAIGTVILIGLLWAFEGRAALRFEDKFWPAVIYGVIGITGFNVFVWLGLTYTRPEHTTLILALQTPLTAIAVWLTRGQRPAAFTLGCIAAALAGLLLVITKGDPGSAFSGGALLGDVLVFFGAVCWIIYTLSGGTAFAGWSPLRMTVLTCITGAVGLFIANAVALAAGFATVPALDATLAIGWEILYFSVCSVVLGVLSFNLGARALGPLNMVLTLNLIPVTVFAIEAALGARYQSIEIAGAAIVIGALVANNLYLRGASTRR